MKPETCPMCRYWMEKYMELLRDYKALLKEKKCN